MNEKVEATKWVAWGIGVMLVLTLIGYVLMPLRTRVEREVFVQSHQYQEGMAERAGIFNATLAQIEVSLNGSIDDITRNNLEAQKASLTVQLNAMRR